MPELPSWVVPGATCVCIEEDWTDIIDPVDECSNNYPRLGQRFTVSGSRFLLGDWYLLLRERHIAPDYYEVIAFEPEVSIADQVAKKDKELFERIAEITGDLVS